MQLIYAEKPKNLWRPLHSSWAHLVTLLMFLNVDQFISLNQSYKVQPKYWWVVIFLCSIIFLSNKFSFKNMLSRPIFWWALIYIIISSIWIFYSPTYETGWTGLSFVITTILFVLTSLIIYQNADFNEKSWKITIWLVFAISNFSIVYDYISPGDNIFYNYATINGLGIEGRSAGIYLNPNTAGMVTILIATLLIMTNSPTTNLLVTFSIIPPILMTLSRGAMIGWVVLFAASFLSKKLPRFSFFILISIPILIFFGSFFYNLVLSSLDFSSTNANVTDRYSFLFGQSLMSDTSTDSRREVANYAWNQFIQSPIFGHGLGYMWIWDFPIGTHNLILRHMVEYGLIGVAIYPLFIYSALKSTDNAENKTYLNFIGLVVLIMSAFSHNILEQGCFMFPYLAMHLGTCRSRGPSLN